MDAYAYPKKPAAPRVPWQVYHRVFFCRLLGVALGLLGCRTLIRRGFFGGFRSIETRCSVQAPRAAYSASRWADPAEVTVDRALLSFKLSKLRLLRGSGK